MLRQLVADYGNGFEEKDPRRMIRFPEAFPDGRIVAALSRQLGWSHLAETLTRRHPIGRYATWEGVTRFQNQGDAPPSHSVDIVPDWQSILSRPNSMRGSNARSNGRTGDG